MKILVKNYKKGYIKAKVENLDDLWYLSYVIEKGDKLKSFTYRKIKLGKEDERSSRVIKKPVTLTILVDRTEFSKYSNVLRVLGTVSEGPEDIPLGSHHTLNIEENSEFFLTKNTFLNYQIEKIEESSKDKKHNILVCVHDRDEAYFALIKKYGYDILTSIKGNSKKKADVKTDSQDFFTDLGKILQEYDKRYAFSSIVVASPGFWREYIQKILNHTDLKEKVVYATCSSVGINGINEVMKRSEVQKVLQEEKFSVEIQKVEQLLEEISKQGKATYGLKQIKDAVDAGAVSEILITDDYIHKTRQNASFDEIEQLMRKVEQNSGSVFIISSEHDGGKKLDGLGGLGALLRYKLSY